MTIHYIWCLNNILNRTETNENNNGDKFSPCRTPVSRAEYPDVLPVIEMQDFALL